MVHLHSHYKIFHIVHWRLWTKVHKIFYTCKALHCLFGGGLQLKIILESQKRKFS